MIETTDNHPFWVEGKGWVVAVDLQVGDQLKQSNGHTLTIDQIEIVKHDQKVKVYNFTVADFHTYFVSDLDIWVHNITCSILDWTITNRKNETRWDHVQKHTKPNMNREIHGVFNGNPVSIINQAWNKIQEQGIKPYIQRESADMYRVPFENAGVGGGTLDNGKTLNYVEIVVMEGTNKLLTGYPVQ